MSPLCQCCFALALGSSIFEVLPATFYSIGTKESDIEASQKWLQLLKKFDLLNYVKNRSLKPILSENDKHWCYLGPVI